MALSEPSPFEEADEDTGVDGRPADVTPLPVGNFDVAVVDPVSAKDLAGRLTPSGRLATFASIDALVAGGLAAAKPTVVVCGPGLADDDGLAAIRSLGGRPEVGAVLVADELTTPLLQSALRAGVRDALALSEGSAALQASIRRVGDHLGAAASHGSGDAAAHAPGRVIVCFSTKGGVGKSVVSTNLAVLLAQRSARSVAIVDADLQFGDVAVLLGVPPEHTIADATSAIHDDDPELVEQLMARHEATGLRVLPAPVEPSTADLVRPEEMLEIVNVLRERHDFVVVDMPPHFDDVVIALLEAADDVLLVASMDIPSIKNLKVGMQTLDLLALAGPKLKLVLNRANARVNLDVKEVERALGLAADFPIPSDIAVPQSVNRGVPVVLDSPRSPAARALESLRDGVMGVDESTNGNRRRRWALGRTTEVGS